MAKICANGKTFDVTCVVFDKDGTLMDFEQAWGQRTVNWVEAMITAVDGDEDLAGLFFHALGYDVKKRQVAENGPILVTSAEKLVTLAAGLLYAHCAMPWHDAETLASETAWAIFAPPLSEEEIHPLGDVQGTIGRLREAGIAIAVATADNRDISARCLELLGIIDDIDIMMCGDDPLPQKPEPGVLAWIAAELALQPQDILMVGDTINDMLTGRNAGAAGCIAISPNHHGGSTPFDSHADAVLRTVAELAIC